VYVLIPASRVNFGGMYMHLTPRENDRLTIFLTAELARRRFKRGILLNLPETIAILCDELLEQARLGEKTLVETIAFGAHILTKVDVMPGVEALLPIIQVEGLFLDGSKLISVHEPIRFSNRMELENEVYMTL
jgi:urease gamma subunit